MSRWNEFVSLVIVSTNCHRTPISDRYETYYEAGRTPMTDDQLEVLITLFNVLSTLWVLPIALVVGVEFIRGGLVSSTLQRYRAMVSLFFLASAIVLGRMSLLWWDAVYCDQCFFGPPESRRWVDLGIAIFVQVCYFYAAYLFHAERFVRWSKRRKKVTHHE